MPAKCLFRAVTILGLLTSVGCQTTGSPSWNLWQSVSNDPKADLQNPERLHLAYGKLSEQTGDYATARENYESALRQNGQTVEAVVGLARLDLLAGRPAEAERRFREAVEIAPSDPLAIGALGQFYLTQNRYADAAEQLQRGVDVAPENRRLRHKFGEALARGGNIVAAEPQFVRAVGPAEADYNIGLILYQQGHIAESEQRFLQAVLKKPTLAPAQHWLDVVRQEHEAKGLLAGAPSRQNTNSTTGSAIQAPSPSARTTSQSVPAASNGLHAPAAGAVPFSDQNIIPTGASTLSQSAVHGSGQAQNSRLNPATMNATQLEQYENSLSPAERSQLRAQLQSGTFPLQ
ncbi:MAG: tetratricopeptide repeat protein [Planctomycetota bacterium]|nr:tetratricopeptide repeat protein [Planctomycetota bacterium]MDA1165326.1 tetratricopeptide repeat protein [Planctomycetota bacterium]